MKGEMNRKGVESNAEEQRLGEQEARGRAPSGREQLKN